MSLGTRVRLCLKDLYAQDVVEMIERETRKWSDVIRKAGIQVE